MPPVKRDDGRGSRDLLDRIAFPNNVYSRLNALERRGGIATGGVRGGGDPNVGFPPEVPRIATAVTHAEWDGDHWVLSLRIGVAYGDPDPPPHFAQLELEVISLAGYHNFFFRQSVPAPGDTWDVADSGFLFGNTYSARLRAQVGSTWTSWCDWEAGLYFAPELGHPDAPAWDTPDFTDDGIDAGGGFVTVHWLAATPPIGGYRVAWRAHGGSGAWQQVDVDATTLQATPHGWTREQSYDVQIGSLPITGGAPTWNLDIRQHTVHAASPDPPTVSNDNTPVGPEPGGRVAWATLTWAHPVATDHWRYQWQQQAVSIGAGMAPDVTIHEIDGTETQTIVHNVPYYTPYHFRMRTVTRFEDIGAWSAWTTDLTLTPPPDTTSFPYNGDFEIPSPDSNLSPDGWEPALHAGITGQLDGTDFQSGLRSLQLTVPAYIAGADAGGFLSTPFPLSEGQGYELSFWGKYDTDPAAGVAEIILTFQRADGSSISSIHSPIAGTTWTRYLKTGAAPPGTARARVRVSASIDTGSPDYTAHFDGIVISPQGSFLRLQDVGETTFSGHAGQAVVVNGTADGLAFGASPVTDAHYVHTQISAATTWTVTHNLGKYPAIQIFDSANDEVMGDVHHDSTSQATLSFGAAFSGTAICN
jgi:hypothetical protein